MKLLQAVRILNNFALAWKQVNVSYIRGRETNIKNEKI